MTLNELFDIRKIDREASPWLAPFPEARCPQCLAVLTQSALLVCSRNCEHCGTRVIDHDPASDGEEPTPDDGIALPTVDEYIEEVRPYQRARRWGVRGFVGAVVVGVCVILIMQASLPQGGPRWLIAVMYGWVYAGIPLLLLIGCMAIKFRSANNPKLICPQCHKPDVADAEYIISSRCCARCGVRRLLENPVTDVSPTTLYPLPLVIENRKRYDTILQNWNGVVTPNFVAFALIPICITMLYPFLVVIIAIAAILSGIVLLLGAIETNLVHTLRCSCCEGRLRNYASIIATKNCYHCGERVIVEPELEPLLSENRHDAG